DFGSNSLAGSIPDSISAPMALSHLGLNSNSLNGSIPYYIFNWLDALTYLDLSSNSLVGSIPDSISALTALASLDLSSNSLTGSIPNSISELLYLGTLDVHQNEFSGIIPATLGSLDQLDYLNTSGTSLTCPAADSTTCAQTLSPKAAFCQDCGTTCSACQQETAAAPAAPAAASGGGGGVSVGGIIGIAVAAVVVLLLLLAAMLLCFRHQKRQSSKWASLAASHCTEFSLAEVLKATNDWSQDNLLGSGAFGDVYKGVSPRDATTPWAVKRAKLMGAEFQRE
ncbi:unnamed protein product, partial [Closterium sp. NIES-64]